MTKTATAVLEEALHLEQADRAELAGALLESLEPPGEQGVEDAWRREVAARVAAVDAGEVATVPWDEVRDRLFARLSERHDR